LPERAVAVVNAREYVLVYPDGEQDRELAGTREQAEQIAASGVTVELYDAGLMTFVDVIYGEATCPPTLRNV
jgi:hypothetical protein